MNRTRDVHYAQTVRCYQVLLVDDHPIIRQGLRGLLQSEREFQVCGEAETSQEAKALIRERRPDVVVVDLALKDSEGLELVRDTRARHPKLPILMLSMQDETFWAPRLLAAGANGYLSKGAAAKDFITALRQVLAGKIYVSEQAGVLMLELAICRVRDTEDLVQTLSDRELQVLGLLGRGFATQQIANQLNLSHKTVESHRQRIKRKLALSSNAQLVQYAVKWSDGRRQAQG